MKKLNRITQKRLGIDFDQFCEQYLGSEYKTFLARMRKTKYFPVEVWYTCCLLGAPCEELFGNKYLNLVMVQGKYGVPGKMLELWEKATPQERLKMLSYLGLSAKAVEITSVSVSEPEAKSDVAAELYISDLVQEAKADDPAPEKKEDDGLYIETYGQRR